MKLSLLLPPLALVACSAAASSPAPTTTTTTTPALDPSQGSTASSPATRDLAPQVSASDRAALVAGNTEFALAMDHAFVASSADGPNANLFFAPHSISIAMAMAESGARGTTADEIRAGMHYTLGEDRLHPAFDWLDLELSNRKGSSTAARPFHLHFANSLWPQAGMTLVPSFVDTLTTSYGAAPDPVDFGKAKPARATINAWVSDHTDAQIPELLGDGDIDPMTKLVIVNAIDFDAPWKVAFDPAETKAAPFTTGDGRTVSVPMMAGASVMPFGATADATIAELSYTGDALAMDVILPNAGVSLDAFAASLDGAKLAALFASLAPIMTNLWMPRFTLAPASANVTRELSALGIHQAFGAGADFSGTTTDASLYIARVIHQAKLHVSESGTDATAATAVIEDDDSGMAVASMTLNRPFFLVIRDVPTGAILFVGHVSDPTEYPAP